MSCFWKYHGFKWPHCPIWYKYYPVLILTYNSFSLKLSKYYYLECNLIDTSTFGIHKAFKENVETEYFFTKLWSVALMQIICLQFTSIVKRWFLKMLVYIIHMYIRVTFKIKDKNSIKPQLVLYILRNSKNLVIVGITIFLCTYL